MGEEKFSAKIVQFDGAHYDHWSELMENLLRVKGLWNMIDEGFEEPIPRALAALTEAQRTRIEEKRAIDKTMFKQILDKRNFKNGWESLKTKYRGNERVKRVMLNALRHDFEVLQMKEG
ncbi:hypothetical protein LXL04_004422 [Taraxacum kok-saghyz]